MYNVILFDLDGTLIDSSAGITKCVQQALQYVGIDEPDLKKLECFIGPPLKKQLIEYAGLSDPQADTAVAVYRERYERLGIFENRLYDGVLELLRELKRDGKILAVASSKPTVYVRQILKDLQLDVYFDVIVGAELDGTRSEKAEEIEAALELLGMTKQRSNVLMIGDRKYDVQGAAQCGLPCIGVAYGFGGQAELMAAGAVSIVQSAPELLARVRALDNRFEAALPPAGARNSGNVFRKIWRTIYPIGIHFGISLAVSEIGSLLLLAWASLSLGLTDFNELYAYVIKYSLIMTGVAAVIAIPILSMFYKKDCNLRSRGSLGTRANNIKYTTKGIYAATVLAMISLSQVLNDLITVSGLSEVFPSYSETNEAILQGQPVVVLLLIVVICAPVVEELIFRGLMFKRIQDYLGTGWGIAISALSFGIYHGNMIQFVYAGLLGIALALLMARTNSLKVVIVAHLVANLWSVLGAGLLEYISAGNPWLYSGFLVILTLLAIFSLGYIVRASKNRISGQNA